MLVSLVKNNHIYNLLLPSRINGNYWITDVDKYNFSRNLLNIKAENNEWIVSGNYDVNLINKNIIVEKEVLKNNCFYNVNIKNEESCFLFCSTEYINATQLKVKSDCDIVIGSNDSCQICTKNEYIDDMHAKLYYRAGIWTIENVSKRFNTYINNTAVGSKKLKYGDIIFIGGLRIVVLKGIILLDNPNNDLKVSFNVFEMYKMEEKPLDFVPIKEEKDIKLYEESDYFFRSPRFKRSVEHVDLVIDPAPAKVKVDDTPAIFVIGPMLTMGMTSMVSAYSSINSVITNNGDMKDALPSIVLAIASLGTMIFWPIINKKYQNYKKRKTEKLRQTKYKKYIDEKREFIKSTIVLQSQILKENNENYERLKNIILTKNVKLWERILDHDDFLNLNIGTGVVPVDMEIKYPEKHFSLEDDNLQDIINTLVNETKDIVDAPIEINFVDKYISAIIGQDYMVQKFTDGLLLQVMAYHGYDDLKIVVFTSEEKKDRWRYIKKLPHLWNNDKSIRFFSTNINEAKQISAFLDNEFHNRNEKENSLPNSFKPYYLIIIDSYKSVRDVEIIKNILSAEKNNGFSIVILNDKLSNLPKECMNFICIPSGANEKGGVFENEIISTKQKEFLPLIDYNLDLTECVNKLANIPLSIETEEQQMTSLLSFLEMYNVGTVEQLNISNRWKTNNPIQSLQAPVGIDKFGQLFNLDVHEKFHGPHGLIAGMTGSGKSEFIITYILSLAVNYHPYEVSFVLIDYKGGGLAGAFDNKNTGIKLPHIAGTITNLDTVEMKRALASIESELRRRQKIFNEARELTNESTIDIYKYQKLFREGTVSEPVSHLFIISDEFAELKVQQPEFMDNLISTARIGRSLGIHLILATQKPSGVVNDQIWSNSRFRVCLKVQEKSDSMDMIKCPDAATLKNTGRFYLQVGYNEYFAIGQSAWCGAKYHPSNKVKKKIDNSIDIVDNTGYMVKKIEENIKISSPENKGEQLKNILEYIINIAKEESIITKKLWIDRIPNEIYIGELETKYNFKPNKKDLTVILGEYDDPGNQRQGLVTCDLAKAGNSIITGIAGSGKSLLISSIIYSSIINYNTNEINFYLLEFGSGNLKIFSDAPQVGDIVIPSQVEKTNNIFKMFYSIIDERKLLLEKYDGNFNVYNKKSGKVLPLITVIINNYEAFSELYNDLEEDLVYLTREGNKYGLVFIISCNAINSVRYKLRQNFKNDYLLQLNDDMEYSSILGKTNGTLPSKNVGRGLIKLDNVYEFQTAYCYDSSRMSDYIKIVCDKLNDICKTKALKVPILPEIINSNIFEGNFDLSNIPLGIQKENLSNATYNFKENYISLISSLEQNTLEINTIEIINQIKKYFTGNLVVLDVLKIFNNKSFGNEIVYIDNNYNKIIKQLIDSFEKMKEMYNANEKDYSIFNNTNKVVCVITGMDQMLNKIDSEDKTKFLSLLEEMKDYMVYNFVIIGTSDSFGSFAYDSWYKTCINSSNGIWLGNGISTQSVIKVSRLPRELDYECGDSYGYIIRRGKPVIYKVIEDDNYE